MLPHLGGLSVHGPPAPTGPNASRWFIQEYHVHWREIEHELRELLQKAIDHKMDFHPHDPGGRILEGFLTVLRGKWGDTPPETQLARTLRFLGTYARPFGIYFKEKLRAEATLMEQLHDMVRRTLLPGLRKFLKRHPEPRPQYYIRPWHRTDFYEKLHALHPDDTAALNRDLDELLKPLLKGDNHAWFGRGATQPKDDVLAFFRAWLPDAGPNDQWTKFTHPGLRWSPEQMVTDFALWKRELQKRLYKRAAERAGEAGPSARDEAGAS